jgi:hypothetical protein
VFRAGFSPVQISQTFARLRIDSMRPRTLTAVSGFVTQISSTAFIARAVLMAYKRSVMGLADQAA